ncbi:MAG: CehA/McbA family metallohydrolase [Rhodospirillaceae bacterium]|nr:CehA/McbA family metallohydrolase [Rhodospirillaceae bacterium]
MKNLPFGQPGQFYKGNLHTHSTLSDGKFSPADVVAHYQKAGYDFLALSEHFIEHYDFPIADSIPYRSKDFTTLITAELHVPETQVGEIWHILAVGLPLDFAPPKNGETGPEIAARAAREGAFIGIVHPSWYGLTLEDARSITCAHGIEIYNHGSHVEVDRGTDWGFCDSLLNEGWRLSGFATDDSHHMTHDCFGGWVQVHASSLDPDEIVQSLKAGRYYSSQGPEIFDVRISEGHVDIECSPVDFVSAVGRGALSVQKNNQGMTHCRLPLSRFKDSYFRISLRDELDRRAWSNPIWRD